MSVRDNVSSIYLALQLLLSGGLGWYLLSIALLGASFGTFRYVAVKWQIASEVYRGLALLLQTPQEPLRPDMRPTIGAAVMGQLSSHWDLCSPATTLNVKLDAAFHAFRDIYRREPKPEAPVPHLMLVRMPPDAAPAAEEEPPTTERAKTTYRLPAGVVSALGADTDAAALEQMAALNSKRVRSLIALEYLATDLEQLSQNSDPDLPTVERFFFLSTEGAIRLMPAESLKMLTSYRPFNHANYAQRVLASDYTPTTCSGYPRYVTLPYIDLLKLGLVATACYPVKANGAVAGVFCADVAPPKTLVQYEAMNNSIFAARLFDVLISAPDLKTYECADTKNAGEGCRTQVSDPGLVRALTGWHKEQRQSSGIIRPANAPFDDSKPEVVTLWTRKTGEEAWARVAVLSYRHASLGRAGWGALGAACLLLASCVAVLVCATARQSNRRAYSIARGLQVGVVRLDANGVISDANERAEHLLMRKLPRFGVSSGSGMPVRFDSLIAVAESATQVVVVREAKPGVFSRVSFSSIEEDLRKGLTSRYFAKFPRRQVRGPTESKWLQIVASPIMKPDGGVETFALVRSADAKVLTDLDRALV